MLPLALLLVAMLLATLWLLRADRHALQPELAAAALLITAAAYIAALLSS